MSNHEDAPFGVFRLSYSLFVWISAIGLTLLTVWIIWIMFILTPSGMSKSRAIAEIRPTQSVVAQQAALRVVSCRMDPPENLQVCTACHVISGKGNAIGPSLAEIIDSSRERLADSGYGGDSSSVAEYIRESIVEPSAYIVASPEGKSYVAGDVSVMPANVSDDVPDLDYLVEYLIWQHHGVCEEIVDEESGDTEFIPLTSVEDVEAELARLEAEGDGS